jgi:hypothetical protein
MLHLKNLECTKTVQQTRGLLPPAPAVFVKD